MFAKITNNAVEIYPYNTRIDYPNTAFPVGSDYPEFDVYWVHDIPPSLDSFSHKEVESDPIFNTELQRWEQSWNYVALSDEEKRIKRYNDSQFMQEMIACASFKEWIASFPSTDRMIFFDACTNAKIDKNWTVVQVFYDGFKQAIAPSTEAIAEWTQIAFNNGIPIVF